MTKMVVPYCKLKESIFVAFEGDEKIFSLYDPNVSVSSVEEIVNDIHKKISEYDGASFHSVYEKSELVGYFVNIKNQLISFGLSVKYRTEAHLEDFFQLIKKEVGSDLFVYLWQKNIRAIKWMYKNGMKTIWSDNNIIKLQCQ